MKLIFQYIKPYRLRMLVGLMIKIVGTFADLGLPWVLAHILDEVVPLGEIRRVLLWGIVMVGLAFIARTGNILANRKASAVARDVTRTLRHDLFQKIEHLSGNQTDRFQIPSLISRMTSDTYNIHGTIGMMQRLGVRAPMILVGGIIITATLEPVLTLVLLILVPILGTVVFVISKKGIPLYTKVQEAVDGMVRIVRENISGIRVIKALSKTDYERERFAKANETTVQRELKTGYVMSASGPSMSFLLNLGLTLVIIVGAFRVNSGASAPGKIVAFLSYFTMILNAVIMINRIFVNISKATASANRIALVLAAEDELPVEVYMEEGNDAETVLVTDLEQETSSLGLKRQTTNSVSSTNQLKKTDKKGKLEKIPHIVFDKVCFGYQNEAKDKEKYCIRDVSFSIKSGEGFGIIGATGSGKSTLLNLLMRFYDVSDGAIYINGKNVKEYELEELRAMFGVVYQNDVIFADTIYENISFGRDISLEEVQKVAEHAGAAKFIAEKENAYEYKAAIKGANLSGGQKQRLLIARALAGKPEILLLDDSSSALDYKTDAAIRKTIREQYAETTTILVAQRVSSVMQMKQIAVMEEGEIIGLGTHEELLATCSVYKEIYDSQMGSDLNGKEA